MTVNIHIEGHDAVDALAQMRHLLSAGSPQSTTAAPREYTGSGETSALTVQPLDLIVDPGVKTTHKPLTAAQKKAAEKAAAAEKQAISTGEERTGPEDSAEDVKQDAADEALDSKVDAKAELTHESIRDALGGYVKKFGMPAAQEDGPKLLAKALGEKADKSAWKISEIPNEQAPLAKVLAGVVEMTEKNPFKRDIVKAK